MRNRTYYVDIWYIAYQLDAWRTKTVYIHVNYIHVSIQRNFQMKTITYLGSAMIKKVCSLFFHYHFLLVIISSLCVCSCVCLNDIFFWHKIINDFIKRNIKMNLWEKKEVLVFFFLLLFGDSFLFCLFLYSSYSSLPLFYSLEKRMNWIFSNKWSVIPRLNKYLNI